MGIRWADDELPRNEDGIPTITVRGQSEEPKGGIRWVDQSVAPSRTEKVLKGGKDVLDAGAQTLSRMPGADAVNRATAYVNELPLIGPITKALGMTPATSQQIDAGIASSEKQYQARRAAAGEDGFDGWRMVGNLAATAPIGAVGAAAKGAGLAARLGSGIAQGAGFGLMSPVTDPAEQSDFGAAKLHQAEIGAATGGAATLGSSALARVIRPNTSPEAKKLLEEGVKLTPGQILGGTFRSAEERLRSVPILGDAIAYGERNANASLNQAAYRKALAPIGQGGAKIEPGREAISEIADRIGKVYDDALTHSAPIRADQQLSSDLAKTLGEARAGGLSDPDYRALERLILERIAPRFQSGGGVADPRNLKTLDSELAKIARQRKADSPAYASAVDEVRQAVRGAAKRSNAGTPIGDALDAADAAWARYKRIERAAGYVGANEGAFNAAHLNSAVKAMDSSPNKGQFAKGRALMQDLSAPAADVMKNRVPDSGTAGRLMAGGLLGGGYLTGLLGSPALLAGAAGSLAYMPGGRAVAQHLLSTRPAAAEPAAEFVRRYGVMLTPAAQSLLDSNK